MPNSMNNAPRRLTIRSNHREAKRLLTSRHVESFNIAPRHLKLTPMCLALHGALMEVAAQWQTEQSLKGA